MSSANSYLPQPSLGAAAAPARPKKALAEKRETKIKIDSATSPGQVAAVKKLGTRGATSTDVRPCPRGHRLRYVNGGGCVPCQSKNTRRWQKANPGSCQRYRRRLRARNPAKALCQQSKQRATAVGLRFTITPDDLLPLPTHCPVLGLRIKYTPGRGKASPNSASVDRIDSRKGYVPGNVRVISHRANQLKSSATPVEAFKVAVDAALTLLRSYDAASVEGVTVAGLRTALKSPQQFRNKSALAFRADRTRAVISRGWSHRHLAPATAANVKGLQMVGGAATTYRQRCRPRRVTIRQRPAAVSRELGQ